jgi:imidazolonepropionase-like amidohydrolase
MDRVAAGTAMVDELKEFEAAGLTRYDALRTATVNGGDLLGQPKLGTLVPGAPAELILLRKNPLDDLDALRTVEGVVHLGMWTPGRELAVRRR